MAPALARLHNPPRGRSGDNAAVTPVSPPTVRLLVLDIDGRSTAPTVPASTIAAVDAAIAAGVRVALATRRMPSSALPIARRLGIREPIIGLQGAAIREIPPDGVGRRGRLLLHRPLAAATAREAVAWCRGAGLTPHLHRLETMYFDRADEHLDAWSRWVAGSVRIGFGVAMPTDRGSCWLPPGWSRRRSARTGSRR